MATAPGTPTITVTPLPDEGSVRIDVAGDEGAFSHVQWSLDGSAWTDLRYGTGIAVESGGVAAVNDDEALVDRRLYYRARLFRQDDTSIAYSPWSATVTGRLLLLDWYLSVPELPNTRLRLHVPFVDRAVRIEQPMAVIRVKNRRDAVTRYGLRGLRSGSFVLETRGEAEWRTLNAMLDAQKPLLVQQPNGEHWYLRAGGIDAVMQASSSWVTSTNRTVTIAFEECFRP